MIKIRDYACVKIRILLAAGLLLTGILAGCGGENSEGRGLDPAHPVTIVLWNYYSGKTKAAFDEMARDFNDTVGLDKGIIVDTVSYGDVNQLAEEIYSAASNSLGAAQMPDIFGAYPDNIYRLDQLDCIVNLDQYFSEEDLNGLQKDFLVDCRFGSDNGLKMLPAARSTDVLYLNKTQWDEFAAESGAEVEDLSDWEGLFKTAESYHAWSGKAFIGFDSFANYFLSASMQTGQDLYRIQDGEQIFEFTPEFARYVWDHLYVPYIKGYYGNFGAFSSDDAKAGAVAAYIASSAGAQYFPRETITDEGEVRTIECVVLPYPCDASGNPFAIVQGAGFALAKSDETHEYAASLFLKWLLLKEQNMDFAVETGYTPIAADVRLKDLLTAIDSSRDQDPAAVAIGQSVRAVDRMLGGYQLYSNQPAEGSYELRRLMEEYTKTYLSGQLGKKTELIETGISEEEAAEQLTGDEYFENWYQTFLEKAEKVIP